MKKEIGINKIPKEVIFYKKKLSDTYKRLGDIEISKSSNTEGLNYYY